MANNLISCDLTANRIYKHSGISSTILDSFDSPGDYPYGLTYDGVNLISCDADKLKIWQHVGIAPVKGGNKGFDSPDGCPSGLAYETESPPPPPTEKTLVLATLISISSLIVLPTLAEILKFTGGC